MTITTDNYESWFYRYSEGELNESERREVEAFAAQHPALADELSLYDPGLKLQAAPIVYADKERLMHREQRTVPLWRWAVAACLAATMVTVVWLFTFDRQADGPIVAQATLPQPLPEQQPATVAEPATVVESSTPVITKRHRPHSTARFSTLSSKPTETAKADPTADVVAAEPVSPLAEEPLPAVAVKDEPTVVIYHEIYVVAEAEPLTVEENTATAEPESGIESLFAFGRSLGARLRAERLRIQGETRVALASL
jgi:hypothetical protein